MLYLAQVQRKLNKPKLLLSARKRIDEVWMPLTSPEILLDLPPQCSSFGDGFLVMVDVNDKQQVLSVSPALPQIVRLLQDYSSRLATVESRIAEWKETMALAGEEEFIRQQQHQEFLDLIKQDLALQNTWDMLRNQELKYLETVEARKDLPSTVEDAS